MSVNHPFTSALEERRRPSPEPRALRVPASLLPKHLRPHLSVFHRFVQLAHRVVDDPDLEPEVKLGYLDALERALGSDQDAPVQLQPAVELRASLIETGVTDRHARQFLRALRRDAAESTCRTWNDLLGHCRRSAVPIGRFLLDLHAEDEAAGPAIDLLCTAMRLLGLLQSARADWVTLGRCHLPTVWFDDAGISIERMVEKRCDAPLRAIFDRAIDHAERLLDEADGLPHRIRHRTLRLETSVMLEQARALARALRNADPLHRRVAPHPVARIGAITRGVWRGLRSA